MKLKTLEKKIRRLETRLLEGPKKPAKLKRKNATSGKVIAATAKKNSAALPARAAKNTRPSTAKSHVTPAAPQASAPKKVKRNLHLSPERREQLAEAMRARWAAKRAAEASPPDGSTGHDFRIGQVPQSP